MTPLLVMQWSLAALVVLVTFFIIYATILKFMLLLREARAEAAKKLASIRAATGGHEDED